MIKLSKSFVVSTIVGMVFLLSMMALPSAAQDLEYKKTVIAGGPDKFAEVQHVVLKGSNFEIGKKIGEIAKKDGTPITPSDNQPKKMAPPGCSVTFYPASATEDGHNILSRNYDFITGDITGRKPQKGRLAMMARPILFEIYPDQGYSSISLCAFEYLGGVLDGINSEGLVVSILAEEESGNKVGREPGDEVGMHELMGMRYLLDNCKNVEEAKEALLSLKHYYSFIPCHYIIGDGSGKSFIFEFAPARNRSYIIDSDGPQCVTNHLVFHHQNVDEFPETGLNWSLRRYKMLNESIKAKEKFSLEEIAAINAQVAVPPNAPGNPQAAPGRTLWYSQYDLENLTLTVKFYLGEKPDLENEKRVILEYSVPKMYELKK